jgi:hypothetical protein
VFCSRELEPSNDCTRASLWNNHDPLVNEAIHSWLVLSKVSNRYRLARWQMNPACLFSSLSLCSLILRSYFVWRCRKWLSIPFSTAQTTLSQESFLSRFASCQNTDLATLLCPGIDDREKSWCIVLAVMAFYLARLISTTHARLLYDAHDGISRLTFTHEELFLLLVYCWIWEVHNFLFRSASAGRFLYCGVRFIGSPSWW